MLARRSLAALLAATLTMGAVGCATHGRDFRMEDARRVEIGMTKAEVVEILGTEPSDYHEDATGELWMWNRVVVTLGPITSKSFAVKFKDGRAVWIQR